MAAANSSSGVGAVRPNVPQSSPDTFFRVTVDNALTFDFPTLSGAAAFIEGYGSGDLFEVDSETGLQTPVDVVPANLSQIPPGPAADDPVASGEAEAVDPLSCAGDAGIPVSELSGQSFTDNGDPAESGETHQSLGTIGNRVTWHCLEHRGETIFASQEIKATKRQQRLAGIGTLTTVKLPNGEEPPVHPRWPDQIQRLAIKRGFITPAEVCDNLSQTSEPPVPIFQFDDRNADKPDPTPQEIRQACLEIQAGWSPIERRSRQRGICGTRTVYRKVVMR